jgi:inhibitor of cysteine peptidase
LLIILGAISLAACGGKAPMLKVSDPQHPITIGAGEEFSIILEANPTTGYHWAVVGELDQNVVRFVKTKYISTSAPNLAGGGGLDAWTFKAVETGETKVTLGYYPPSNDPVNPKQTTIFTVVVK